MKRIRTKLLVVFLCMTASMILILWLIQAVLMKNIYLQERVKSIDDAIKLMIANEQSDYQYLEEDVDASFLSFDEQRNLRYMSHGVPIRGKVIKACLYMIENNEMDAMQILDSTSGESRYALLGRALGNGSYLFSVFSLINVDSASKILGKQLWAVTVAFFIFSIIIAIIISRKFSHPIKDVTEAARSMAAGKLEVNLPIRSKDEIGQLTMSLNNLGKQLMINENLQKELIANVSHELRSPLSVIRGYAETVRDVTWPHTEKRTEQLTLIADETERLSHIVTDILDYSKLQSGAESVNIERFSLLDTLKTVVMRHELEASHNGVTIKLTCPDITASFDKAKFEQVVDNLLCNALSHAERGSNINVIAFETEDAVARISIKNKGTIIPKNELSSIWDRYYRTQQINKSLGTGLGLAIAKSIFDLLGVKYGVISQDDETTFWFDTCSIT